MKNPKRKGHRQEHRAVKSRSVAECVGKAWTGVKSRGGVLWSGLPCPDLEKIKGEKMKDIWTIFDVRFDFLTSLCASVPANRDLIEIWLRSRAPKAIPPGGRSISE